MKQFEELERQLESEIAHRHIENRKREIERITNDSSSPPGGVNEQLNNGTQLTTEYREAYSPKKQPTQTKQHKKQLEVEDKEYFEDLHRRYIEQQEAAA